MSKRLLLALTAIFAFAFGPMPLFYRSVDYNSDPRLFDCMYGHTQQQCQQFAKEAEKTKVFITTPFLAMTINEDIKGYYAGYEEPKKDFIYSPTGMFLVPLFFSGFVTLFVYLKYDPQQQYRKKLAAANIKQKIVSKPLVAAGIVFLVFPFPLIMRSYDSSAGPCSPYDTLYNQTATSSIPCGANIDYNIAYVTHYRVSNLLPGWLLDEQLRSCTPASFNKDDCYESSTQNSDTIETTYKTYPYYGLLVPIVAASATALVLQRKNRTKPNENV